MSVLEPYRIILDYEALQEAFLDRIEDLNTTIEQIEMAGEMGKNQLQKCLVKNPGKAIQRHRDHRHASNRRTFGWESLGKTLKGTGLALVLVVDDERFAPIRAELEQRKMPRKTELLSAGSMRLLKGKITRKTSQKMQEARNKKLSPQQRRRIAKLAAKARWCRRGVSSRDAALISSVHGQPTSDTAAAQGPPMGDQATL